MRRFSCAWIAECKGVNEGGRRKLKGQLPILKNQVKG